MVISRGIVGVVAKDGPGKLPGNALEIGKDAIALLLPQGVDCVFEDTAIVHRQSLSCAGGRAVRPTHQRSR